MIEPVHKPDDSRSIREIERFSRLTVEKYQGIVIGPDRDNGRFTGCPARHGRKRLPGKFQLCGVTHLFGRPGSHRSHAQESAFDLVGNLHRLVILLVEEGIGKDLRTFNTDVLPTTDRKLPVLMVEQDHGVLTELLEISAAGEHTEPVGIDRLVVQHECKSFHKSHHFSAKLD